MNIFHQPLIGKKIQMPSKPDDYTFTGKLGTYDFKLTDDSSPTMYSHHFDEHLHSLAGAFSETNYNFIQGCCLEEKSKFRPHLNILDIGFGLGTGLSALLAWKKKKYSFTYTSVELDPDLAMMALLNIVPQSQIKINQHSLDVQSESMNIKILIGDALKTLPKDFSRRENLKYDAIFQDPFSPKKCPQLWSKEWFILLAKMAKSECLLSTYSASASVRRALHDANWFVYDRDGFASKRSSTIASRVQSPLCLPKIKKHCSFN